MLVVVGNLLAGGKKKNSDYEMPFARKEEPSKLWLLWSFAIRYCDMVGYRRYRLIREVFKNYLTDFFRFYVHIAHILKGVFFSSFSY